MYRPVLVTPPAVKVVTLAEAKAQLDVTSSDRDAQIEGLIAAATSWLDGWTGILGRCLAEQTWRQDYDFLAHTLRIPLAPVLSVTGLKYFDPAGVEQTVNPENYQLLQDDLGPLLRINRGFSFPAVLSSGPAVMLQYRAGYASEGEGDAARCSAPAAIKHAILLLVRHWFDNPGAVVTGQPNQLPLSVDALLAPFRRTRF